MQLYLVTLEIPNHSTTAERGVRWFSQHGRVQTAQLAQRIR